jgi:hypothetical protein
MHVCLLCVVAFFPVIELNDECEEGEIFEYQEEGDQGQANQDKPSTCCISEPYQVTLRCFTTVFLIMHVFYIVIVPYIAIVGDLAPQVDLLSSLKMTPLATT